MPDHPPEYIALAEAFNNDRSEANAQALVDYMNANGEQQYEVEVITNVILKPIDE